MKIWYNPCIICQYIHGKTDENHVLFSLLYIYTASKFGILYDFCVIKKMFTQYFDPSHNNQHCIKIVKSSKSFMHDFPIPMCASCAVEHNAWSASFWKTHRTQVCSARSNSKLFDCVQSKRGRGGKCRVICYIRTKHFCCYVALSDRP